MHSKLWKIAGTALMASSVMTMGSAMAQTNQTGESQSDNASAGQSTPSQFEQRTNDNDKDWGWLGLLGLLGLAGLRRRRDPDLHRDETTTAKRGSGAYNR